MNNSKEKFTPRKELIRNLEWLIEHDPDRFYFIEALMKAIVNKEPISVEMSLNKDTHTVTIRFGEYMYREQFETLEDAMKLVDMARSIKREVA